MQTNSLGNTGIEVSRICFGTLTVGPLQAALPVEQGAAVLAHAIEQGINFCDTAQLYQTYPYIHRAMELTGYGELVVSSKTYAYTRELAVQAVEEARQGINRDYIDIFMLHEQESIHTLRGHSPALEYLLECKQKGIIRAVGASMHHVAAVEGACKLGLDCIHPILNLDGLGIVDGSRQQMEDALVKAYNLGIGVFSMKPLGGGNLFRKAEDCLSYIVNQPFIHSVAIGMQSVEEVDANIGFWQQGGFTKHQQQLLKEKTRRLHIEDWCEGCGACVKRCGQKALSMQGGTAVCDHQACVLCGYCSTVCPAWAIKVV